MSRLDLAERISIRVGDCLCTDTPHDGLEGRDDGDIVYLDPQLSLEGGLAANAALATFGDDQAALERELGLSYILGGVGDWNFLDGGKPIPLTPSNIRRALPWGAGGRVVAEKANELYFNEVVGPLVERARKLSERGATVSLISAPRKAKTGTRKPRGSSSSATSQTASTA